MAIVAESIDVIDGAKYSIDRTGGHRTKIWFVTGLDSTTDVLAQACLSVPFIPRYGQPHPTVGGLYVKNIEAVPWPKNSQTSAKVTVQYESPEYSGGAAWKVRIGSSQQQIKTTRDKDGAILSVSNLDGAPGDINNRQPVTGTALVSGTILEFSNLISKATMKLWQSYTDQVNSSVWQNGQARTWYCRGPTAESIESLAMYQASICFEHMVIGGLPGWDEVAFYRDVRLGKIPIKCITDFEAKAGNASTIFGNGWRKLQVQSATDFNALGLPAIF